MGEENKANCEEEDGQSFDAADHLGPLVEGYEVGEFSQEVREVTSKNHED